MITEIYRNIPVIAAADGAALRQWLTANPTNGMPTVITSTWPKGKPVPSQVIFAAEKRCVS